MRQELDIRGLSHTVDSLRIDSKNRVFQVWNDRFDDKCVIGKNQLEKFLDYIHLNPLQHHWNLVSRPEDYKFSSACFYESNIQPNLDVTDYRTYF